MKFQLRVPIALAVAVCTFCGIGAWYDAKHPLPAASDKRVAYVAMRNGGGHTAVSVDGSWCEISGMTPILPTFGDHFVCRWNAPIRPEASR